MEETITLTLSTAELAELINALATVLDQDLYEDVNVAYKLYRELTQPKKPSRNAKWTSSITVPLGPQPRQSSRQLTDHTRPTTLPDGETPTVN